MGLVKVTNGMIYHGADKYKPGDVFEAENADNLVRLGVAVFADDNKDIPVIETETETETEEQLVFAQSVEATEKTDAPAMIVEQAPFKKSGKRGRRNRG